MLCKFTCCLSGDTREIGSNEQNIRRISTRKEHLEERVRELKRMWQMKAGKCIVKEDNFFQRKGIEEIKWIEESGISRVWNNGSNLLWPIALSSKV